MWLWAVGTGLPSLAGLALLEWARRLMFPRAESLPHPPAASSTTGEAARQAVQQISQRLQAQDPPLDRPEVLEKVVREVLAEVLESVARHYHPQSEQPVLEAPVARIAGLVELVARDFRKAFVENVPWGKNLTPQQLLAWKERGTLVWRIGIYAWQINRIRRLCMRPGTALVQEVQDHLGEHAATKSVGGLKRWAIDYCVTKAGDYAIQLYSGGFILDEEYRPRISAEVEATPFDQEPLQILVVGQVKAGKSSLINALLGEMRAPVDVLPTTATIDVYECRLEGLPAVIFRDTPGYGAVADPQGPFSRLSGEIQECDLLVMLCSARSAARKADRDLLQEVHEFYQRNPQRIMPPVVCVLTHVDSIAEPHLQELTAAVAEDLGVAAGQVILVCTQWGRLANLANVLAAIRQRLPEAERLKCARCIRQIRKEQDTDKILHQIVHGLRLTGGWIAAKP
jgi:predicted GTPase